MDNSQNQSNLAGTTFNPADAFGGSGDAPAKKSSGLKIGLIVGTSILAAGCIGGGVYAYLQTQPENVMNVTVSNALNTSRVAISGTIYANTKGEDQVIKKLELKLDDQVSLVDDVFAGGSATLTAYLDDSGDQKISVALDGVATKDGVIYVKIDNLKAAVDNVFDILTETVNSSIKSSCAESLSLSCLSVPTVSRSDVLTSLGVSSTVIENLIGEIDGTWWKISATDLAGDAFATDGLDETYSCIINQLRSETGKLSQYSDLFKKYPFATISRSDTSIISDGTTYDLSIDADKLTTYLEESYKLVDEDAFSTCLDKIVPHSIYDGRYDLDDYDDLDDEYDLFAFDDDNDDDDGLLYTFDDDDDDGLLYTSDDYLFGDLDDEYDFGYNFDEQPNLSETVKEFVEGLPTIRLGISGWLNPRLTAVAISSSSDTSDLSGVLNITYPSSISYSAPSSSKSISDLVNSLMDSFTSFFSFFMPIEINGCADSYDCISE